MGLAGALFQKSEVFGFQQIQNTQFVKVNYSAKTSPEVLHFTWQHAWRCVHVYIHRIFDVTSANRCKHTNSNVQYIPRNMHTIFALLCFVVVIHWLIFPYPSGLLHSHCGNLTIAPVPAKQPWLIWINTSCEFIMNDCITTTKQSTTKPCAYLLGYTVRTLTKIWTHD